MVELLTLADLSLTTLSWAGGVEVWTPCYCSKNRKVGGLLGLSFKVFLKILKLVKLIVCW